MGNKFQVYEKVGGYDESEEGLPEDMIFFHKHLDMGGGLYKVQEVCLIKYFLIYWEK